MNINIHQIRLRSISNTLLFGALLFGGLSLGTWLSPVAFAAPATFIVNQTSDEGDNNAGDGVCETANVGECTLRAAIQEANANVGNDTIVFNIGAGLQTISPASALPIITERLSIDGITSNNDGATCGNQSTARKLLISIDGTLSGTTSGLILGNGAENSSIRGLVIGNFAEDGILDQSDGGAVITCNYIGTNAAGTVAASNRNGISIEQTAVDVVIGGTTGTAPGGACRGDCNLLSGNDMSGVLTFSDGALVLGNYVCLNSGGTAAIAHVKDGNPSIAVKGDGGAQIGDGTPEGRNVVAGCDDNGTSDGAEGIGLESSDNTVIGNYVGIDTTGTQKIGNSGSGIVIASGGATSVTGNVIGGLLPGEANVATDNFGANIILLDFAGIVEDNTIIGNLVGTKGDGSRFNTKDTNPGIVIFGAPSNNVIGGVQAGAGNTIMDVQTGIVVSGMSAFNFTPVNNSFLGNSVSYSTSGLGIDLLDDSDGNFAPDINLGVDPNDADDLDSGPNNFQNAPEITNVATTGDDATITYDIDVKDSEAGVTGYRVEFFANTESSSSGAGEGEIYLGYEDITGDVTGRQITLADTGLTAGNYSFAAVATALDGSADGFGSSSEFSVLSEQQVDDLDAGNPDDGDNGQESQTDSDTKDKGGSLGQTGQSNRVIGVVSWVMLAVSISLSVIVRRKYL